MSQFDRGPELDLSGTVVYGVGTDLVSVERLSPHWPDSIQGWYETRLMARVLTPDELQLAKARWERSPERGLRFFASRYAAKEALSKAFGTGIGEFFSFQDVSILNGDLGEPRIGFSPRLNNWMVQKGLSAHLSISDEAGLALAFAVLSFNRNIQ